jgi:hypothetical protein
LTNTIYAKLASAWRALPAASTSILPIHFPPVAQGAHFDFLEGIVNGVQHPVIAYPYSVSLAAPSFLAPGGRGLAFKVSIRLMILCCTSRGKSANSFSAGLFRWTT